MEGIFFITFFLAFGMFIFVFAKNVGEWFKSNNSPRLSVEAKILDKCSHTSHHHHNHGGHMHTSHSTSYYVTFEVQSGDRMELRVPRHEFGLLVEGDEGTLSFQGTRHLGFERRIAQ